MATEISKKGYLKKFDVWKCFMWRNIFIYYKYIFFLTNNTVNFPGKSIFQVIIK